MATKKITTNTNLNIIKQRGKKARKTLDFIVPMAIYSTDILVCLGHNDQECCAVLDRFEETGHLDSHNWKLYWETKVVGKAVILKNNAIMIRTRDFPATCKDYNTLSHEIFHAVELLMIRIGASLDESSSECYAYPIGYLTEKIFQQINETV